MPSIDASGYPYVDVTSRARLDARLVSSAPTGKIVRLMAVALAAASLAACAQSSVVSQRSEIRGEPSGVAAARSNSLMRKRVAVARRHTPFASRKRTQLASQGIASFYSEDTQTASGEKFDATQLTAAHPSFAFRHQTARDRRQDRPLGDGARQRPWPVCARTYRRRLPFGGGRARHDRKGVTNVRLDVVQ